MNDNFHYRGPWHILVSIDNVLCEDGKRRKVTMTTLDADTFYTRRGKIHARGKTVSGYVFTDSQGELKFYAAGKHKDIFRCAK